MLNGRKIQTLIISAAIAIALFSAGGCSKKKTIVSKGTPFQSQEELAKFVCMKANDGDSDAIIEAYIPKKEYLEKVYPQTTEGKSKKHLSGEDYWRILVERQRISDAKYQARQYKGRIKSVVGVGQPKKIFQAGPFKILHRVPDHLEVEGSGGGIENITDNDIMGVVIQDGNRFKLFNVFR